MSAAVPDTSRQSPAARQYGLTCFLSLLVLTLGLVFKGCGEWSLPPLLFGALAVLFHWRIGPVLQPLLLTVLLLLLGPRGLGYFYASELREMDPLIDPLLVAAVLVFSIAHFRLLSLTRNLFPIDARPVTAARRKPLRGKPHLRPPETVGANELPPALLTAAGTTALGFIAWAMLATQDYDSFGGDSWPAPLWQAIFLLWPTALALLLTTTVLSYLRRLRGTQAESLQYLQDQLWLETRGEQSVLNRWLTWARLRRQRAKE